jgi:hypothetical protein
MTAPRRQELNEGRSETVVADAIKAKERGIPFDTMFVRVMGHLGMGRVKASLPTERGPIEIKVQIPNVFGRKGVTPINSQTVLAVFVGTDFNPLSFDTSVHFKLTSILNDKQVGDLLEANVIPMWMTAVDTTATESGEAGAAYVFDYSDVKEGEDEEDEEDEGEGEDESSDEGAGKSVEKSVVKSVEKSVVKSVVKSAGKSVEKSAGKGVEKSAGKSVETALTAVGEDEGFDLYASVEKAPPPASKSKAKSKKVDHHKNTVVMEEEDNDVDVDAI